MVDPATGTCRPGVPSEWTTGCTVLNAVTTTVEADASFPTVDVRRTSTTSYDGAGRPVLSALTASTSPASVVLPPTRTRYDPNSGRAVLTEWMTSTAPDATRTAYVQTVYDTLGRVNQDRDADDNYTTSSYDLQSRLTVSHDGKGTTIRSSECRARWCLKNFGTRSCGRALRRARRQLRNWRVSR